MPSPRAGLLACLIASALLVGSAACSSSTPKPGAPTRAQAQGLLDTLASDVLGHRAGDFLAHLDQTSPAASFRDTQRNDLANLAAVPFASWTYRIASLSTDAAAAAAAGRRLGAPVLIAQVTFGYQLPGVDVLPSTHDLWLTFDTRHGRTYLAGDSDLATAGFPSWAGPWRYGALGSVRGTRSLVLGPVGQTALLHTLAGEVDAAVPQVRAVVDQVVGTAVWPGQVAVIVPSSEQEFTALTGTSASTVEDVSAAAVTDGVDPVTRRAFGQRLVLNPGTLATLTPLGQQIVLRHEITHLATATITADVTPRWLVEGFAEYVANLGTGQPVAVAASELRASVRAGTIPAALPPDTAFQGAPSAAALAQLYEQSWLACRFIASKVGSAGLARFYAAVGQSLDPGAEALANALTTVLHVSVVAFTAGWRHYVQTQLS